MRGLYDAPERRAVTEITCPGRCKHTLYPSPAMHFCDSTLVPPFFPSRAIVSLGKLLHSSGVFQDSQVPKTKKKKKCWK